MVKRELISQKVQGILEEMKQTGTWKKCQPEWVNEFQKINIITEHDFIDWLQFVYLPNILNQANNNVAIIQKRNIVPQALKFFAEDVKKGKLLQFLIELDSLL